MELGIIRFGPDESAVRKPFIIDMSIASSGAAAHQSHPAFDLLAQRALARVVCHLFSGVLVGKRVNKSSTHPGELLSAFPS
jgi:hypothetical protein